MDTVTIADAGAQRFLPLAIAAGAFPQLRQLQFLTRHLFILLRLLWPYCSSVSWSGGGRSQGAWDLVRCRPRMMDARRRSRDNSAWRVCPKVITK